MTLETRRTTVALIDCAKAHFQDDEDIELIRRAGDFAEEHYTLIYHPLGMSYSEYTTMVAILLADLGIDATMVAAALLFPPLPFTTSALDEINTFFEDAPHLLKLIEEALRVSQFELHPWP